MSRFSRGLIVGFIESIVFILAVKNLQTEGGGGVVSFSSLPSIKPLLFDKVIAGVEKHRTLENLGKL